MTHTVVINPFVRRQTADSPFSHFAGVGGWDTILDRIRESLVAGRIKQGYRIGVLEIDIDPKDILSGVAILGEMAELTGAYKSRRPGETPRKEIRAKGAAKMPAVTASIILYHVATLAENGDNSVPVETDSWEVISLNASPVEGDMPIDPMVLMHNHFGSDGGTATGLSDSEFVALLRKGFEFWKDKAMVG
jgi:hypothetical protein